MPLTDSAKNVALNALTAAADFVSLHTAYSSTGTNEVTGGSPAYARKGITYATAASGAATSNGTAPVFDVPASTTVKFVGHWSDVTAGTFYGMTALGGSEKEIISYDLTNNTFTVLSHGYTDGTPVVFMGDAPPSPLVEGTTYYVVTSTTDTFKVEASVGGGAIDITTLGGAKLVVSKLPGGGETFGAQGTLTITADTISLQA